MLVPVFFMFYKHQRSLARFDRNLASFQQNRDEQALRIAQLAREAPEDLTRAERAAVEGKIAWRKSVAMWQTSKKHGAGSVNSHGWPKPDCGEMPSPSRQNGSPSSTVHERYLEMAVSTQRLYLLPASSGEMPMRLRQRKADTSTSVSAILIRQASDRMSKPLRFLCETWLASTVWLRLLAPWKSISTSVQK